MTVIKDLRKEATSNKVFISDIGKKSTNNSEFVALLNKPKRK
jgi:hypothetical protein